MRDPAFALRFLLVLFAGVMNREQQKLIEYLREENRVLREQFRGRRRLRFTNDQRSRLAARAKALGRSVLDAFASLVTPDTLLRWHRQLVAAKWTHRPKERRLGRPPVMARIRELTVRMARHNATWGYARIQGALANLGHDVARTTIRKILKAAGIAPAPERPTSWRSFLRAHAGVVAAADFFTVEVCTARGLVTHYVLFGIDLATRAVEILGVTTNPGTSFMAQIARNLTDPVDGFLRGKQFLVLDRDSKFDADFRRILEAADVQVLLTARRAPNMNAFAERFVRTIKDECLAKLIFFGEAMLQRALREFVTHYHAERNHQALDNAIIVPPVDRCRRPVASSGVNASAACSATTTGDDEPRESAEASGIGKARFRPRTRASGASAHRRVRLSRIRNRLCSRHSALGMPATEFSNSTRGIPPSNRLRHLCEQHEAVPL